MVTRGTGIGWEGGVLRNSSIEGWQKEDEPTRGRGEACGNFEEEIVKGSRTGKEGLLGLGDLGRSQVGRSRCSGK